MTNDPNDATIKTANHIATLYLPGQSSEPMQLKFSSQQTMYNAMANAGLGGEWEYTVINQVPTNDASPRMQSRGDGTNFNA